MKRAVLLLLALLSAAGYVFLQTPPTRRELATLAPAGALLYLESQDFGRLLREWDASKVKADWLSSENCEVFSRSNLFRKLSGVYAEYGAAAGFLPDLKSVIGLAGTHSALALYEVREVEFLYISRVGQNQFAQSSLAAVRDKFERRQAGGVSFYLRTDSASKRTVAFAMAGGYLFVATRDDLVARALALLTAGAEPSVASEAWYRDATAAARPGELRLVMNLESLLKSVYFRSYWIQRNASALRQYWAGVADLVRSRTLYTETRVFLRRAEGTVQREPGAAGRLIALAPPDAGVYKAYSMGSADDAAALIIDKLIVAPPVQTRDWRYAPGVVFTEGPGSDADLETRIDEPPLPADAGMSNALGAIRTALERTGVKAVLEIRSSESAGETFIRIPSAIVLEGSRPWDASQIRPALSAAAGAFLTVSSAGAGWTATTVGREPAERLDGLASLLFAVRGELLFLGNDARLLSAALARAGSTPSGSSATYAAGFRLSRERANYMRIMNALDFTQREGGMRFGFAAPGTHPPFFSSNLASLGRAFALVTEVTVTEQDKEGSVVQEIKYRIGR